MTRGAPRTLSIHVPFEIRKRGGRKLVVLPDGEHPGRQRPRVDDTLLKALARAFRWKRMLDSGELATITELARHEKLAVSYLTRVLRLSLLAPDIVEAIVAGRQAPDMKLADLLEQLPLDWRRQRRICDRGSTGHARRPS